MKKIMCRTALMVSASVSALALLPAAAQAQDDAASATQVEEVVVTAQRRDQRLQDVPITVTAFGAQQIEDAHIVAVQDVITRTPGLSFDAFPASEPRLAVRGIGSSDRGAAGDPSSAVFIDEIYLGRPSAIAFDAFDVERIEVLKGPQGTLYGRNVVGGAVNVITARPSLSGFDAAAEGTLGNYSRREGAGFLNLPFADGKAAFRISGSVRTHDGYAKSRVTGGDLDDQDTRSVRAQLRVEPSDTFRIHVTADSTTDRGNGPANHVLLASNTTRYPLALDPKYNFATINGHQDRDTWGLRLQASWDLPFATLSYLGSHRQVSYSSLYDFDGSNGTRGIEGGNEEDSKLTSHELRLLSPHDSRLTWVLGVYSYKAETTRQLINHTFNFAGNEDVIQDAELNSVAVFGDLTWPLTDKLNVTAGLRYTRDEKDFHVVNLGPNSFQVAFPLNVTTSDSWNAVTWRIGADYHIAPQHMVYGMISRGFKSGGFQDTPSSAASAATPFEPEFATQYEIGFKDTWLDGRLVWNNSFYWLDYSDLQTAQTVGLLKLINNAGKATIKGYETSLQWSIGGGFDLGASYAYTDATFDDFKTVDDANLPVNLAGNTISRTPKHKLILSPAYTFRFGGGAELRLSADYQYESKIFDDNNNQPPEIRDATEVIDARAVYSSADDRWTVSAWGKNLTDERSRTFQVFFNNALFAAFSPPRTYGVTVRWKY